MKNRIKYWILGLSLGAWALAGSGCNDVEDGPVEVRGTATEDVATGLVNQGLFNGNMEQDNEVFANMPNGWRNLVAFFSSPNNYEMGRSEEALEGNFSLRLSCDSVDNNDEYLYAQQVIQDPNIALGSFVRLRAQVKAENLSGNGFELLLLTPDSQGNFIVLATTSPSSEFSGSRNWSEYEAVIDSYPSGVDDLYVWVRLLSQTTGTIYVDDLSLTYELQ